QELNDFPDEERVAFGLGVHGANEFGIGRERAARLDEIRNVDGRQASKQKTLEHALACELADGLREGMPPRELVAAVGAEHEDRCVAELTADEVEQLQRNAVCPVWVVEDEPEPPA